MYTFHVAIQARPTTARDGEVWRVAGQEVATLIVPSQEPLPALPVTFEEAVERLARLPRMFCGSSGKCLRGRYVGYPMSA
jgi:hypothetical protein